MGQVFDIYIHTSYILSFTFCFLHYDWSSPLFFFKPIMDINRKLPQALNSQ